MNANDHLTPSRLAIVRAAGVAVLLVLVGCSSTRPIDDVLAEPAETHHEPVRGEPDVPTSGLGAKAVDAVPLSVEPSADLTVDPLAAPEVLPSREELMRMADRRLAESTELCVALLERARTEDADYDTLMAASRALAFNADLRLQAALALQFAPSDLPGPSKLIDAEDSVGSGLKSEVRSLASSSRQLAERALLLRPEDPAARLFSALGAGLELWSMSSLQALASGAATTLPGRIEELAADHPDFEGAAPLRLEGRFRSRAPWPYGDREAGRDSLAGAARSAPIPLNLLFYGDALWLCGQEDEALDAWRRATRASADEETEMAAPMLRELARQRIESARQNR